MRLLKYSAVALCIALLAGIVAPRVRADVFNHKTIVTFSAPVEIPGFHGPKVLPAGTYVFKLLDTQADRNIVQVFNKNETHLYSTIISVPDYRMRPTGKTVIRFTERATGSPLALRAWFYPGDNYGQEFVYPRTRAMELARANHEAVLSMSDEEAANMNKPIKTSTDASATSLEKTKLTAEQPNGQEVQASSVVQSKPSQKAQGHS
jgi:hypothetical protein